MTQPPIGGAAAPGGPSPEQPPVGAAPSPGAFPPPASGPFPPGPGAFPPPGSGAYPPPGSGAAFPPPGSGAYPPPGSGAAFPPPHSGGYPPPGSGAAFPPAAPGAAVPPPGHPGHPNPPAPKKRRGLLIASIVLAAAVLLCGGGGTAAFLTLRNAEQGQGAKEPAVAVDGFLTAVYKDRDARKAASFVCSASRDDKKIAAKVAEVRKYATQYQNPRFRWTSPKVDNRTGDRATVTTRLTMTTSDEKVSDQDLRFTVVQKTGWWVCEVA